VGRAVNGKWVELPSRDSVPFETFFDSAQPLRIALEQILAAEDPAHPFSDQALAERLVEMGFDVARRTVTKYRLALRIPPAHQRRGT
jgi:RNA polymerase sigma-54 factor